MLEIYKLIIFFSEIVEKYKFVTWCGLLVIFLLIYLRLVKKKMLTREDLMFLYIAFLVLIFSAPIVYFALTTESGIGFVSKEHLDAWIGFCGSIIGGVLTVFGVWWTIIVQNKIRFEDNAIQNEKRKEEMAIQYKPLLVFDVGEFYIANKKEFGLKYKNCGRGEAIEINAKIHGDEIKEILSLQDNSNLVRLVPCNLENIVNMNFNIDDLIDNLKKDDIFLFTIELEYYDYLHIYKGTTKVKAKLFSCKAKGSKKIKSVILRIEENRIDFERCK